MTSCARRWISALARCTESKSRSAVLAPVAIGDAVGLAVVDLPGLRHVGNLEMRYREPRQPRLRPGADAGCAFIADLAAGAGRGAWKRRDRRRMIVRLDLHQNMRDLRPRRVASVGIGLETPDRPSLHHL